jgi:hypothetical protein
VLAEPPDGTGIATADWGRFGNGVCAPDLVRNEPGQIRAILRRLGDARLAAKAARLEARLTAEPPAEVLYQELWDGLGFSANRQPMRALAALVPLAAFDGALATVPREDREALARALLFGAGGFLLPLAGRRRNRRPFARGGQGLRGALATPRRRLAPAQLAAYRMDPRPGATGEPPRRRLAAG